MINTRDLASIEAKLCAAMDAADNSEEDGAAFDEMLQKYTGPETGLIFDDETRKIKIAEDFAPDTEGNILNLAQATGPATGKVLRDGVIVPV